MGFRRQALDCVEITLSSERGTDATRMNRQHERLRLVAVGAQPSGEGLKRKRVEAGALATRRGTTPELQSAELRRPATRRSSRVANSLSTAFEGSNPNSGCDQSESEQASSYSEYEQSVTGEDAPSVCDSDTEMDYSGTSKKRRCTSDPVPQTRVKSTGKKSKKVRSSGNKLISSERYQPPRLSTISHSSTLAPKDSSTARPYAVAVVLPAPADEPYLNFDPQTSTYSYMSEDDVVVRCTHTMELQQGISDAIVTSCAALSFYNMFYSPSFNCLVFQGPKRLEIAIEPYLTKHIKAHSFMKFGARAQAYVQAFIKHVFRAFPATRLMNDALTHIKQLPPQPFFPGAQEAHIVEKISCPLCKNEPVYFKTIQNLSRHLSTIHPEANAEKVTRGRLTSYKLLEFPFIGRGGTIVPEVLVRLQDKLELPPSVPEADQGRREEPRWARTLGIIQQYQAWGPNAPRLIEVPKVRRNREPSSNAMVQSINRGLQYFIHHQLSERILKRGNDLIAETSAVDLPASFKESTGLRLTTFKQDKSHRQYGMEVNRLVTFMVRGYMLECSPKSSVSLMMNHNERKLFHAFVSALQAAPDDLKEENHTASELLAHTLLDFMDVCIAKSLPLDTHMASVLQQYLAIRWDSMADSENCFNSFTKSCAIVRRWMNISAIINAWRASIESHQLQSVLSHPLPKIIPPLQAGADDNGGDLPCSFELDEMDEDGNSIPPSEDPEPLEFQKDLLDEHNEIEDEEESREEESGTRNVDIEDEDPLEDFEEGGVAEGVFDEHVEEESIARSGTTLLQALKTRYPFLSKAEPLTVAHRIYRLDGEARSMPQFGTTHFSYSSATDSVTLWRTETTTYTIPIENLRQTAYELDEGSLMKVLALLPEEIRQEAVKVANEVQRSTKRTQAIFGSRQRQACFSGLIEACKTSLIHDDTPKSTQMIKIMKDYMMNAQGVQDYALTGCVHYMGVPLRAGQLGSLRYAHSSETRINLMLVGGHVVVCRPKAKQVGVDLYNAAWELPHTTATALIIFYGVVRPIQAEFFSKISSSAIPSVLEEYMFCHIRYDRKIQQWTARPSTTGDIVKAVKSGGIRASPAVHRHLSIAILRRRDPGLLLPSDGASNVRLEGAISEDDCPSGLSPEEFQRQIRVSHEFQRFLGVRSCPERILQETIPFALYTARKEILPYSTTPGNAFKSVVAALSSPNQGNHPGELDTVVLGDELLITVTSALVHGPPSHGQTMAVIQPRGVHREEVLIAAKVILQAAVEVDERMPPGKCPYIVLKFPTNWDHTLATFKSEVFGASPKSWFQFEACVYAHFSRSATQDFPSPMYTNMTPQVSALLMEWK